MSDEEVVVVTKRKPNRLNFDSEEEARKEADEKAREEETRIRKEERRKRKEEEAKRAEQEERKKIEQKQKYESPETMLLPDSDSGDSFGRVEKKIRRTYPQFRSKQQAFKRRRVSESEDSNSQSDESEVQESSAPKKKVEKKIKKEKRQKRMEEQEDVRLPRPKVEKVKIEEEDPKERLVKEVAIRWWYCLPQWPPTDHNYEEQLHSLGYRLVDSGRFRMEENLVNGLLKAAKVDGFEGVFRTKLKMLDIRPKESAPSLQFLRGKTIEKLTQLLKTALRQQYSQLQSQKYHHSEEVELLSELERRLQELS